MIIQVFHLFIQRSAKPLAHLCLEDKLSIAEISHQKKFPTFYQRENLQGQNLIHCKTYWFQYRQSQKWKLERVLRNVKLQKVNLVT